MNEIASWARVGGCPPWPHLNSGAALAAIAEAISNFEKALTVARRLLVDFDWGSFLTLDRAWSEFEMLQRLAHAGSFLGFPDFVFVAAVADEAYDRLAALAGRSRGLARGVAYLRSKTGFPAWRRDALDLSGLGQFANHTRLARARHASRASSISKWEKLCEVNIAQSLELSPVWTKNRRDIQGLPAWLVEAGRARAKSKGWAGWVFYAHYREYRIFMATAECREMRRQMYQVRSKAGSEYIPGHDNAMLAKKILAARRAEAKEHGCASFAHYSLASHMLSTPEAVEEALLGFASAATPDAFQERSELDFWMRHQAGVSRLEPWDYRFARARLEQEAGSDARGQVARYLAPTGTIERAIQCVARFLGVQAKRCRREEVADLLVFEIVSPVGFSGHVTVVPRARPSVDEMVAFEWTLSARTEARKIEPASMVFLRLEEIGGRVANLTHSDLVNLFHELGHAFHAVLGVGRHSNDSPKSIEPDAMEMHSQLTENLAWDAKVLLDVGRCKGRRMPKRMAESIAKLRNFHPGATTIAQVTDALCDIRLHHQFNPRGKLLPWEVMVAIRREVGLDSPKTYNRQALQLGAFLGSYVCGDYVYLWSEGLAFKIYQKWRQQGGGGRRGVAASSRLRNIFFDKGARVSMRKQIIQYLGQEPTPAWLAESRGFLA